MATVYYSVSCVAFLLKSSHQSGDFSFIRVVYSRGTGKKQGEKEKGNYMFESFLIKAHAI